MKKVALIVEGKGDVKAVPSLIAKAAAAFGIQLVACEPPIRAGEAKKLKRQGELERYLRLASSRDDAAEIYVVLDLDDGCAKDYAFDFNFRAGLIAEEVGKPVHVIFCVREYETLFLSDIGTLQSSLPEYGIQAGIVITNPETIRPAKETLRSICLTKGYKQIRDQVIFTKKINVYRLGMVDRSFRKLLKAVTSKTYEEIADICSEKTT